MMLLGPNVLFRKVTIIGVGLMGGSLGKAIKKHNLSSEVTGFSQKETSLAQAIQHQAIDVASTDLEKAVQNADLVVFAAPVGTIVKLMPAINHHLKRGCIITDLGSVKGEIVETAEKTLSNPMMFIGSHPLAGSDKTGVEFASAELFENALCIMTPTPKTGEVAKKKIKQMWTEMGARVKEMSPEEHDEILGFISHLPHLAAFGLMDSIPQNFLEMAAQGLKDTTRVAASSPQMWNDICLSNKRNVIKALDALVDSLSKFRKAIVSDDQKNLMQYFTTAKEKRDGIQVNGQK